MTTAEERKKELIAYLKYLDDFHKSTIQTLQTDKRGRSNQQIPREDLSRNNREFKRRIRIRNSERTTQIEAIGSLAEIDLRITSRRLSPQQRRLIAVTFIRQIRPWLKYFTTLDLCHWEHQLAPHWYGKRRGVPTFKSRPLDTPTAQFGAGVRMRRLERGWTQRELAQAAGVGACHLSEVERGLRCPRSTTIQKLEKALSASL